MDGTRQGLGHPCLGLRLGPRTRWDPVSLNNGYGLRKRSINSRDPFRKGTGLFLIGPVDTGTFLTTAFFLQPAGAPYAKE
jgi:hypothetical protein